MDFEGKFDILSLAGSTVVQAPCRSDLMILGSFQRCTQPINELGRDHLLTQSTGAIEKKYYIFSFFESFITSVSRHSIALVHKSNVALTQSC